MKLTDVQYRILRAIGEERATESGLVAELGITAEAIRRDLALLQSAELVEFSSGLNSSRTGSQQYYRLTRKGEDVLRAWYRVNDD